MPRGDPHSRIGAPGEIHAPRTRPEPNVTPLIDILLVLLVIFLAALPLTQKSIDSNLPRATQTATEPPGDRIVLEYSADGRLAINNEAVTQETLEPRLRSIYEGRSDKTMYVIGASTLRYKKIIEAIDAAKGAGVERLGIVTEGSR